MKVTELTDKLRILETERDEAVKTAESSARTAVRLEDMSQLLERLALEKVQDGDEDAARQVLKEKAAVKEVLSRSQTRAQANFSLAARLAEKIGTHQAELMERLTPQQQQEQRRAASAAPSARGPRSQEIPVSWENRGGTYRSGTSGSTAGSTSSRAAASPSSYSTSSSSSGAGSYSSGGMRSESDSNYNSSGSSSSSGNSSGMGGGYEAPWEKSIAQAKERISRAEAEAMAAAKMAAAAGQAAAWRMPAKETIEEARDRLRAESLSKLDAARQRVASSNSSRLQGLEEARARLAAQDAAALAQVRELVRRYRSGEYVPEDQLEWAFQTLENRAWRGY